MRARRTVSEGCTRGVLALALLSTAAPLHGQNDAADLDRLLAGTQVVVVPFRNIAGGPDTNWIGEGIAEVLATDLAATATVVAIDRAALADALAGADALALCRRAGARWIIQGGYQLLGAQVRVTARLLDCETGAAVRRARVDGRRDELFALQDRILPALGSSAGAPAGASAPAAPARLPAADAGVAAVVGAPPPPVLPATLSRNDAGQATVRAVRLTGTLALDGILDEAIYRTIDPISDFVQYEPVHGALPTEKTEVWLFFDDTHFYITARCWHSAPESEWIANEMRRDSFNLLNNEHFGFMLDTFYDRRNGIIINITPIGGRMDGQIADERDWNGDWNPIWNVRTGRFDGGWTLEAEIPFKSLRYRPGRDQVWGIQLRRNLQSKNEVAYLTPLDLGLGRSAIFHVSQAATLVGVEVPSTGPLFEVKPYLIGDLNSNVDPSGLTTHGSGNVGLDIVKYGVTENLTLDFTLNTDFAQVEADEQQVNLTRFSLFFPEKREFFLENQGVFGFGGGGGAFGGSGETPIMFYSRQIGLTAGREVPIVGGGRLTGRAGRFTLGLVNIQTGEEPTASALGTNFTVARLKRNVLRRSSIGAIVTNRSALAGRPGSNQAVGVDAAFAFYDNISLSGYWAKTRTTDLEGNDTSYKGEFSYNGDRYGLVAEHLFVDERFSPGVGFLRRPDLRKSFGSLRFSPRPASIDWIRRLSWQGSFDFITDAGGTVETREAVGSFQVELENSDGFDVFFANTYDLLQRPFAIASDVTIPVGAYNFSDSRVSYRFGPQRRLSGNLTVSHGSFYGGTKSAIAIGGGFGPGGGGRIEVSPQFAVEPGLSINRIELPQGSFTTQLVTTRATYTFTPTMFVSALMQYNSSNSALSTNVRLRWEYQPGSELFIVFNEQRDSFTPQRFPELENRAFVVKINRLFRF